MLMMQCTQEFDYRQAVIFRKPALQILKNIRDPSQFFGIASQLRSIYHCLLAGGNARAKLLQYSASESGLVPLWESVESGAHKSPKN